MRFYLFKRIVALSILGGWFGVAALRGATFTVTSTVNGTNTDGVSLRWAMSQANSTPGIDVVAFNIPGPAPHTILLTSYLPNVSQFNIVDGTTQPPNGYSGTGPKIIIDGGGAIGYFQSTNYLNGQYSGLWIRNFTATAISSNGSSDSIIIDRCRVSNCGSAASVNGSNHYLRVQYSRIESHLGRGISSNGVNNLFEVIDSRFENNGGDGAGHNGIDWIHQSRGSTYINNSGDGIGGNGRGNIFCRGDWLSGNQIDGIAMNGSGYTLVVDSSIIGLDSLGQTAMSNLGDGIFINGSSSTTFDIRNSTISGNGGCGVCNNGTMDTAWFFNNRIGTDISGTQDRGNGTDGINIRGYMEVGGVGLGNVISGNGRDGVVSNTANSIFLGNFVGTDPSAMLPLPNGDDGMVISGSGCRVGGTSAGEPNAVAFNGDDGIYLIGQNCPIRQNRIFCNLGEGIELNNSGNANYPVAVITGQGANFVSGNANPFDEIEVFEQQSCPCSGQSQGWNYIGTAVANAAGFWIYNGAVPNSLVVTATNPGTQNTSEFSSCQVVLPAEIVFFAEAVDGIRARLSWEIPEAISVESWQLERSVDATHFTRFTNREATEGRFIFREVDSFPPARRVWYRLITFSSNGESTVSEAQEVEFPNRGTFRVWPNPGEKWIWVSVTGLETVWTMIDLIDSRGRSVKKWQRSPGMNQQQLQLELPALPAGLYMMRLHTPAQSQSIRLVVE